MGYWLSLQLVYLVILAKYYTNIHCENKYYLLFLAFWPGKKENDSGFTQDYFMFPISIGIPYGLHENINSVTLMIIYLCMILTLLQLAWLIIHWHSCFVCTCYLSGWFKYMTVLHLFALRMVLNWLKYSHFFTPALFVSTFGLFFFLT